MGMILSEGFDVLSDISSNVCVGNWEHGVFKPMATAWALILSYETYMNAHTPLGVHAKAS